jgi:hypothetical protein
MSRDVPPRGVIAHTVDYVSDPHHDAKRLFGPRANAEAPLDLSRRDRVGFEGRMYQHRAAILRRPGAVLDVLGSGHDQLRERLSDADHLHDETISPSPASTTEKPGCSQDCLPFCNLCSGSDAIARGAQALACSWMRAHSAHNFDAVGGSSERRPANAAEKTAECL